MEEPGGPFASLAQAIFYSKDCGESENDKVLATCSVVHEIVLFFLDGVRPFLFPLFGTSYLSISELLGSGRGQRGLFPHMFPHKSGRSAGQFCFLSGLIESLRLKIHVPSTFLDPFLVGFQSGCLINIFGPLEHRFFLVYDKYTIGKRNSVLAHEGSSSRFVHA